MWPPYRPFIPADIGEVVDVLGWMMLNSPDFRDKTGYMPARNIDTTFFSLNEGLQVIRGQLGEEMYLQLREMSDRMRPLFEADPEEKTGDCRKGDHIIDEMVVLIEQKFRKR